MGRPREFDEAKAIDKALRIFWRLGYADCSISELVRATGLKRQSLYNAYTDKHGLFLAVLKRYGELVEQSLTPLKDSNAGLPELRSYIENFLKMQQTGSFGACLLVKTALEPVARDPRIRLAIESGAEKVKSHFAVVIKRAKDVGALPDATIPKELAAYFFTILHGLSALIQAGGTSKQVEAVLSYAFDFGRN